MYGDNLALRASIFLGLLLGFVASQQPQATVEQGALFGTTETFQEDEFINITKNIDVFKGIPFAEPPVGALRFRAPVEKSSWGSEVYNATYFRDACIQNPIYYIDPQGLTTSEDCLHLNVFAPKPRRSGGVPVMVWIHGGGYALGSASQPFYNGIPLAAVGDVIIVTINYRLDVFGFLTTGDSVSPGNVGLQDQVLALKWINKNIAAFGGDNECITIFGESAGAGSVSLHILSKMSEGLFNQAIMQSGTAFSPWSLYENKDNLRKQAFQIGEKLDCGIGAASDSAALVSCLRGKDAKDLFKAAAQLFFRTDPVVDGEFLSDTPANLYSTGQYNHAKILLGSNADEATYILIYNPQFSQYLADEDPPFIGRDMFEQLLTQQLYHYYGPAHDHLADAIRSWYIDWSQADNKTADYFQIFVESFTDFYFACGIDRVARFHAQEGDDVFLYQMTHVPGVSVFAVGDKQPGWAGSSHAEDIPFVFGNAFLPAFSSGPLLYPDSDKELSVKFMEYWTNFAKTGNPGMKTPGSPIDFAEDFWPKFTIPELRYKELNVTMATGRALKSNQCHFWNTYLIKLQTMLASVDKVEREWRESYSAWKYTDMPDWREQFNQYKSATGRS
ncbi:cholinesterase 1-like [Asterias rubens]|uniref:cholinesterase 1-like n=1 Tax=Asterias rubens TaxID=7604 RepID=UPI00145591E7|nr:cholinesterase 1-like [Asterias rubens]